jgi:hypothetical protein
VLANWLCPKCGSYWNGFTCANCDYSKEDEFKKKNMKPRKEKQVEKER